jgi:hypothetical protein
MEKCQVQSVMYSEHGLEYRRYVKGQSGTEM